MNATTVAVDLAKKVFEIAVADAHWRVVERQRLTRAQFERWFDNRSVELIVMGTRDIYTWIPPSISRCPTPGRGGRCSA